jgi:transposase
MSKTFRPWDVEQNVLLSVRELVPAGHMAHFVRDTVRENLDLSRIMETYTEERGYPPYHPAMMVALLLYAYSRGVYSSRKMAQACEERIDFIAVTAMNRPDHRTIARFRRRHLKALGDLFVQVLRLCRAAGLVRLGHVALDGTKMQANASLHKAMSYGRMREAEKKLSAEVSAWLAHAETIDTAEDREHGADKRGDEMPDWVANKAARLERIRAAKAVLEAEAKKPPPQDDDKPGPSSGMMKSGKPERGADGGPPDRAQRNFTDPDSRIQPTRGGGVIQGYNAVIGGRRRWRKGSRIAAMATKLTRAGRRSRYRFRKQIVEPVFGQIKHARGFRQFLLRGFEKVKAEWALICTAHNLLKLAKATR